MSHSLGRLSVWLLGCKRGSECFSIGESMYKLVYAWIQTEYRCASSWHRSRGNISNRDTDVQDTAHSVYIWNADTVLTCRCDRTDTNRRWTLHSILEWDDIIVHLKGCIQWKMQILYIERLAAFNNDVRNADTSRRLCNVTYSMETPAHWKVA